MSTVATSMLETSPRVQVRVRTDDATIVRYAEGFEAGAVMPPIVVFRERGTERYVVADGIHRLEAAKRAGMTSLNVDLREGDETAALEFALGCNAEHGLQRTQRDIEQAVGMLMSNAALAAKYRTHEERAGVLKVNVRTFQRYLALWREKDSGSERERKARTKAIDRAAKHSAAGSAASAQENVVQDQSPNLNNLTRVRFESPLTRETPIRPHGAPAQPPAAIQVRESVKPRARQSHPPPKPPAMSAITISEFKRALLLIRDLPPAPTFRSGAASAIDWSAVEQAHAWLDTLLENR